jgi:hypothetical protein
MGNKRDLWRLDTTLPMRLPYGTLLKFSTLLIHFAEYLREAPERY